MLPITNLQLIPALISDASNLFTTIVHHGRNRRMENRSFFEKRWIYSTWVDSRLGIHVEETQCRILHWAKWMKFKSCLRLKYHFKGKPYGYALFSTHFYEQKNTFYNCLTFAYFDLWGLLIRRQSRLQQTTVLNILSLFFGENYTWNLMSILWKREDAHGTSNLFFFLKE